MESSVRSQGLSGPRSSSRVTPRTAGERPYRLQSVDRAIDLLEFLADAGSEGLALGQAAEALGTSKSTAFALLRTLTEREFVASFGTRNTRRFRLGLALARLGDQAISEIAFLEVATPSLHALTEETEWTSRIGVLEEGYAVIVGRVEGPGVVRFKSTLARLELAHSTAVGKAILSQFPEERVREIVATTGLSSRTPKTITDIDALLDELARIRARGYSIDDEEDSLGVICIGAPVFDHARSCIAAISVTGLKLALPAMGVEGLAAIVSRHAAGLSRKLGLPEDGRSSCS